MGKSLQLIDMSLPIGNFDAYVARVNQIPMLTREEEYEMATKLRDEHDLEAARRLIMAHLRFVVRIARNYTGYGLNVADLVQEGNVGLMKAVKRYDPDVGVRLVSFAVHWVKSEIHEFIIRNWRIVKVATTKAQRKLFFNLRSAKKRLGWFTQAEQQAVADDLGVSVTEVNRMETRLNAQDASFDMSVDDTDSDSSFPSMAPAQYLEDHSANPERLLENDNWAERSNDLLQNAIQSLDERSQDILQQRWLLEDKATLHELADKYDVSAERIRQLEKNAMKKLKGAMLTLHESVA